MPECVACARQQHKQVELWTMDEHRIGLKPVLRRLWAVKGQRPVVRVQHRFEWLYLWAFVNPESGKSLWYILPRVGVEAYNLILADFAKSLAASPDKHILLVQDRAGWHTSKRLVLPTGVEPVYLPPYSPELQPAERLWRLSDAPLFNRSFVSLADLEAQLEPRCVELMAQPDLISKETLFYWWPLI